MGDFIALRCPSCGGDIHVEKNLEKMFCTHCGTQLLLKQGADGLLTPMIARDLQASAQLKETQNTLMVIEILKSQIKELEEQANKAQKNFGDYISVQLIGKGLTFYNKKAKKIIDQCSLQFTGKANHDFYGNSDLNKFPLATREDLLQLYQFITQPQRDDKTAHEMAQALYPLVQIELELQEKKQKLKQAMDGLTK